MKNIVTKVIFILVFATQSIQSAPEQNQQEKNIETIRRFFDEKYNDPSVDAKKAQEIIERYIHPDYVQHVDGKTLYYKDSLPHRVAQLKLIKDIKITFDHLAADGDKVYSIHRAKATKLKGGDVEVRVFALFRLRDGKIYFCDELTHVIKGEKEDKEIGSKH